MIGSKIAAWVAFFAAALACTAQAKPGRTGKTLGGETSAKIGARYLDYWNEVVPAKEATWGAVEAARGRFDFAGMDALRKTALSNGLPYRLGPLVWGGSQPTWAKSLGPTEAVAEFTTWLDSLAMRYPNVSVVEVVREGHPSHSPSSLKAGLGGEGATGFDWIAQAFAMARRRWPQALLVYDDYGIVETSSVRAWTVQMAKALRAKGAPIGAIGCQAGNAGDWGSAEIRQGLDEVASQTGLEILVTGYDLPIADTSRQRVVLQNQFPIFWNHPSVVGVSFQTYGAGGIWTDADFQWGARGDLPPSALRWLMDYVAANPDPSGTPTALGSADRGLAEGEGAGGLVVRDHGGRLETGRVRGGNFLPLSALGRR